MACSSLHTISAHLCVQNCCGEKPNGLVAVEVQEWVRLKLLPRVNDALRPCCRRRGHPDWLQFRVFEKLCRAVGRKVSSEHAAWLLAMDWDARHTNKYLWSVIDPIVHAKSNGLPPPTNLEKPIDRRTIPKGEEGWIPLSVVGSTLPSAARMHDTSQFPIESTFAPIKRVYWKILSRLGDDSPASMVRAIKEAFRICATPERIHRNWVHAENSLRVFCGELGTQVQINGETFHCTHGNWVPAKCRG